MDETNGFDQVTTNELFELLKMRVELLKMRVELLKMRVEKAQRMFNQIDHQNEFELLASSFATNVNEIMLAINIRLVEE